MKTTGKTPLAPDFRCTACGQRHADHAAPSTPEIARTIRMWHRLQALYDGTAAASIAAGSGDEGHE